MKASIYNMYGTTETAIVSHWYKIPNNFDAQNNTSNQKENKFGKSVSIIVDCHLTRADRVGITE